ncbi:MAG: CotH kinase family protein [Clostridia bacterium]|nr:CotH kinase family protein [Clostridia bacterium]
MKKLLLLVSVIIAAVIILLCGCDGNGVTKTENPDGIPESGTELENIDDTPGTGAEQEQPEEGEISDDFSEIKLNELPIMIITTKSGAAIVSKEEYTECTITVMNAAPEYEFEEVAAGIRGRGNSTWLMPKKPYKLKFDKKIDLFGNGEAKKWTIIANYCDPSLVRNDLAYAIGGLFDELKGYTTLTQNVDLYFNGEYAGVYTLCEQVEVGKTRVNISDDIYDKKAGEMISPEKVGYLIEMDVRAPEEGVEGIDYFLLDVSPDIQMPFAIKSPDTEDERYSANYSEYIKAYIEECYAAVCGEDWSAVASLLDPDSFAATYIVHELFNCIDCGQSSVYFYKVESGKLYSGPLWDFDISCGNCNYGDENITSPELPWAKQINFWYNNLLRFEEFREIVKAQLLKYDYGILKVIEEKEREYFGQRSSFERNFTRWKILGVYVWPNSDEIVGITTWQGQVEYLVNWLKRSLDFLETEYCK